ncbi:N-alpha-acetyltransferase 60-like [Oscarella lobularis]|uniref:N-alpha-acetyltransferase 60-like n=1 Tax=Oscarella lobularis TaxID=121494 RepID=UPI0033132FCB
MSFRVSNGRLGSIPKPPTTSPDIQGLFCRLMQPSDIDQVKALCAECFPINYPENWFVQITSSSNLYSLAAVVGNRVIGMIVVEVKPFGFCNPEDSSILSYFSSSDTKVAYILSFGVFKEFRNTGIGSHLLQQALSYLESEQMHCKAVYLHVMASNFDAIKFYERRGFKKHTFLPGYYTTIGNQLGDGCCYVKYINGGEAPWSLRDCLSACWRLPTWLCTRCKRLWRIRLASTEARFL